MGKRVLENSIVMYNSDWNLREKARAVLGICYMWALMVGSTGEGQCGSI